MKLSDVRKWLQRRKKRRTANWVGMLETLNDCNVSHTFFRSVKDTNRSFQRPRTLRA